MTILIGITVLTFFVFYLVYTLTKKGEDEDYDYKNPLWWKQLFWLTLSPSVLWPAIVLGSFFLYDNPREEWHATLLAIILDTYPLYMIAVNMLVLHVFKRTQSIAKALCIYLIPPIVFAACIALIKITS